MENVNQYLEISQEIVEALNNNLPIVALESTIISHGMPYPQNRETALQVEQIVRDNGAIPATIGIINGKMKVGLSHDEIDLLAKTGLDVIKVSRRDLALVLANKQLGATTVATTMLIASMANIKVFATGGIGGVHRNAEVTMDISADLEELAMTNVAVVCAGAKSILDLGLTLEYLETKGVPVIGYQTDYLPAFYTNKSQFKLRHRLDSAKEIAQVIKTKFEIGLNGGLIIANPIPSQFAMDEDKINGAIDNALLAASEQEISGKDVTPFLLDAIVKATDGQSLAANIQLVFNNAKLASEIARNLID